MQKERESKFYHFHHPFPLPPSATLQPYSNSASLSKKNKHKLKLFTYYHTPQLPLKVLFLDDDRVIHQGHYPFTDPTGQMKNLKELGQVKRMHTTECAYVTHFTDNGLTQVAVKKLTEAKIEGDGKQLETVDDHFEVLPVGNQARFTQFLKVIKANPNSASMTIRAIVDENGSEGRPTLLDFEFFGREAHLLKSKQ